MPKSCGFYRRRRNSLQRKLPNTAVRGNAKRAAVIFVWTLCAEAQGSLSKAMTGEWMQCPLLRIGIVRGE
jgi:hypothetical protein